MKRYLKEAREAVAAVNRVVFGKEREIKEVMLAFLADGHILIEDIPGVGKTTMALAFSRLFGLEFKRIQFTPDVMPSDLTGFSIYSREEEKFVYQPGSVFCNLLLADELNRTSPKTQSALLEVMEERKVTVEGVTREVGQPFLVIATQNPLGSAGTQLLPEAQIDRFMVTISLGYPDMESELSMAKAVGEHDRLDSLQPILHGEALREMQREIHGVYVKEEVYRYLLSLVRATRNHPYLARGASPRATIALVKMAKASAWFDGRTFVTPRDVREQFPYVVSHRIVPELAAAMEKIQKEQIVAKIVEGIAEPPLGEEGR